MNGVSSASRSAYAGFTPLRTGLLAVVALTVMGCSDKEVILPGERLDIRAPFEDSAATTEPQVNRKQSFSAPRAVNNANWTHRNGGTSHYLGNPSLRSTLAPLWSASIGEGDSRKNRLSTDPVAANGRIFTLDSRARVSAHATNGGQLWSVDLTPTGDRSGETSGGGLAVANDVLIAVTGFGEMIALNVKTGAELWTQRVDANFNSNPTIYGDLVYAVSRDNIAWAVNIKNGRVQWQIPGTPSPTSIVGSAGPAISGDRVLFPFSSGEILSAFRRGGVRLWASSVSGRRPGAAYAGITDITGDPVVVGSTVYAANASGRTVALDLRSGDLKWTAPEGSTGPLWVAGGSVFLVSDQAKLVRLNANTGDIIWKVDLPYFEAEKIKKRKTIYAHHGPVLAGGRLWLASTDGYLRSFDPTDGREVARIELPDGATTNPIVVNNTLYIVTTAGNLLAYR
ncbi:MULTISPECIES: PQQ-like beta-propeller repeat protein [Halocynthiibacter]|uniref:PQQ-like beta-propeller repeat protein n=1 Tax=Halocynthiibacter halioticoli TaxID=2986804 RepID=A0AAE3LQY3_9RHOB|nr:MULTISPECIES: PQQ-like beta-propeller repeat protein [Halocynthiibacter]MCV6824038.1 PQQ-like beta-propeller repeat protein [Halocynthiibacter halioticoli]MCW4057039.1 PQQ-like beta-propeller repeat protein [Halocynthiibacter sp. SDUM655004]